MISSSSVERKWLHIIFILLILLANGLLIFKNVRKCDFMYKPKTLTILSLAIGDVFLALFPMVVYTNYYLEDYNLVNNYCHLHILSNVYRDYLINFVYGIGLIVLGLAITLHPRISNLSKLYKLVCSMFASSIPWILGLIIILPLGLANIDGNYCRAKISMDQLKTVIVISRILPACGAVITFILVCMFVNSKDKVPHQQAVSSSLQKRAAITVHNSAHVNNPSVHQQTLIPTNPENQYLKQLMCDRLNCPSPAQYPYCSHRFYNLPTTKTCPLQTQPQYTPHPRHCVAAPGPMESVVSSEEVSRLLIISLVYFMLVTPSAVVIIIYFRDVVDFGSRAGADAVADAVTETLYWLPMIRSFITPVIMYDHSKNNVLFCIVFIFFYAFCL